MSSAIEKSSFKYDAVQDWNDLSKGVRALSILDVKVVF